MANVIGSLFVELNLNSAQFADGVNKANATTKQLSDGVKKFGEQSNYSMLEARHGVMILGEELGVHMPRAVSTMIASIGPVGGLFAAAFPVLGAIALIEVIAKVVEHFQKAAEQAREFANEEQDTQDKANLAAQALELENLKLDDQIAKIRGGATHNALQEQILEINKAAGALAESLDKVIEKTQKTAAPVGFFANIKASIDNLFHMADKFDLGKVNKALEQATTATNIYRAAQAEMDALPSKANQVAFTKALDDTKASYTRTIVELQKYGGNTDLAKTKIHEFTMAIEELSSAQAKLNLEQQKVAKEAGITAAEKERKEEEQAAEELLFTNKQLEKQMNALDEALRKADTSTIRSTKDTNAFKQEEADLNRELRVATEVNDAVLTGLGKYAAKVNEVNDAVKAGLVTQQAADAYLKQYAQDLGVMSSDKEIKKVKDDWKGLADEIGGQIARTVTNGKMNFKELFTSIEDDITKMLVSKALDDLLKKLSSIGDESGSGGSSSSSGGGGGGGFGGLISFFGGLFGGGKAEGGPVAPGVAYLVGEQGQEMFVPRTPGTIVPNSGTIPSTPMHASVNIHVHGATDPDTFRRATPQIMADAYRHLQIAHAHNGR